MSFEHEISVNVWDAMSSARILFWHGRETAFFFDPPPSLNLIEGRTKVDLAILSHPEIVVFVEAKYQSKISSRTTHGFGRNQIIRNIDVGTYYARKHGDRDFIFILLSSAKLKHQAVIDFYRKEPQNSHVTYLIEKTSRHRQQALQGISGT